MVLPNISEFTSSHTESNSSSDGYSARNFDHLPALRNEVKARLVELEKLGAHRMPADDESIGFTYVELKGELDRSERDIDQINQWDNPTGVIVPALVNQVLTDPLEAASFIFGRAVYRQIVQSLYADMYVRFLTPGDLEQG